MNDVNTQVNGKYEIRVVVLLGMAYGFAFYDRMIMTFLGPFVVPEFELNNTQLSALGSGLSLTWAIGAYVIGRWSDQLGVRKPFLIWAMVIFSVCSLLSGLSTGFWTLLASRMLMGLVEGPFLPICLAIVAAASATTRRGLNAGIVQNTFGSLLGAALAPVLSIWIAQVYGWRVSFFTAALPGLILAIIVWRFIHEPVKIAAPAAQEKQAGSSILDMLAQRNIVLCSMIGSLIVGSASIGAIFYPVYLTLDKGFSNTTMSTMMLVLGLCPPIGGILVPFLSDRFGRKPLMIIFCGLMTITPLAVLYYSGSPVFLSALMFIGWIGMGVFPLFMGVVPAETLNFRNTAAAMGLVIAISELVGGVTIPFLAGMLGDLYGRDILMLAAGLMCVAAMLVACGLKETNRNVLIRRGLIETEIADEKDAVEIKEGAAP